MFYSTSKPGLQQHHIIEAQTKPFKAYTTIKYWVSCYTHVIQNNKHPIVLWISRKPSRLKFGCSVFHVRWSPRCLTHDSVWWLFNNLQSPASHRLLSMFLSKYRKHRETLVKNKQWENDIVFKIPCLTYISQIDTPTLQKLSQKYSPTSLYLLLWLWYSLFCWLFQAFRS